MADAAVEFILEELKDLLMYNVELLSNVKSEVEGLQMDLDVLQGFIKDFVGNRDINHEQQALLNSIRTIIDKAEDAIENFIVETAKHREKNTALRIFHSPAHELAIRKIAVDVKEVGKAVERIHSRESTKRLLQARTLSETPSATRKVPRVEEYDVVGLDKEADDVIRFLMEGSLERDVLGIVGMAGLGKTTLTNKVFKDERIDYEFIHRAWFYVSKYNKVQDVFISVLKKFTNLSEAMMNKMDTEELAQEVKKCLEDKKYLVVLDDVSLSTPTWDELEVAFPRNNKGSRILLTTRIKKVAENANDHKKYHNMKFLDERESLELLNKKIFGKGDCPLDLLALAQLVANKCEGLPLAIVVIAGIISPRREEKEWWEQVAQRVNELVNVHDSSNFNEVVAWSFNSLSYNKKLCFLYLGIFPRGPIAVRDVTRLWVAEGFIQNESKLGFENEAVTWLYDLVDRNLVMAHAFGLDGGIQTCRVHDSLRDYCKLEAERQKFYHEIDRSNLLSPSSYRRICVHKEVTEYISAKAPDNQVHTFISFPERKIILLLKQLKTMLKAFKRIRVLEVSSIEFPGFPKTQLQELALLRYLAFSCDFKSIPRFISSLRSLQTLIILTSASVLQFPEEIWNLHHLRHLQTTASAMLPSPPTSIKGRGKGHMQTLSKIGPESCTEDLISMILYVKKLGVRGKLSLLLEKESKLIENLGKLQELTNLKLFNDAIDSSPIELSPKIPKMLTKLTLSNTFIAWEHMSILGDLDKLRVLKLKDNAFRGDVWRMKTGSFPSLRVLHITRTDLRIWEAGEQQFQSLIRLVLNNCDQLIALPSCLIDIRSFSTLDIYCCSEVVTSAKELCVNKALTNANNHRFKLTIYPPEK